ncbi:MAG: cupin domain-containing protein [Candidatus Omnitrophica bacterium]|nr:cupin domain-containing protein [Candidatus Omnitrophota bacterium]
MIISKMCCILLVILPQQRKEIHMKIGKSIRHLRKEKGMTLEELAEKSGVALATLSRMENDKMTGTLDSHNRICKALNTSLAELYREVEEESKTIETVPKKRRTEHFMHSKKARYELLVETAMDKKIMPLMIRISSGGETQKEKNKPGVEKFVYMISGTIEATVGSDSYALKNGDSLYFDASLSHSFKNKSKTDAEAICIISPPAL